MPRCGTWHPSGHGHSKESITVPRGIIKERFARFARGRRVLVAGLGKSGTSALFYLVRNSLAPNVEAFFEPSSLDVFGKLGKHRHGVAKVLLPNALQNVQISRFIGELEKVVLIVRDPRDLIVSRLLYRAGYHTLHEDRTDAEQAVALQALREKERNPSSISLLTLFSHLGDRAEQQPGFLLKKYRELLTAPDKFLSAYPDSFVYLYENLVRAQYDGLAEYLGFDLQGEAKVDTVHERVVRTKGDGNWRHWFTPSDVETLRPVFADFMQRFNYENDWRLAKEQAIDPQMSSEYVIRVLETRRNQDG